MSGRLAPLGPAVLSVGAGVCLWASFAPLHLWPSAVLGVALLVAALRGRGFCASFACGFATGAVFFGLLCDWATEAAGTWIARAGLGGVLALYIGVLALVWQAFLRAWGGCAQATTGTGKAKDPKATAGKAAAAGKACAWKLVPALAVVWVAVEDLQGTWPEGGMPWGKLAFGQVEGPLVHLAPYGSTELVSFAVVALGASLAYAAQNARARPRRALATAAGVCAALAAAAAIPLGGPPVGSAKVGFVQGNVSRDKSLTGYARAVSVTERLAKQTRKIEGKGAELVLWPESSSDLDPETTPEARDVIEGAVSRLGVPLVLGIQRYPEDYRYNEYTLWLPGKGLTARYTKLHPVPFGEYIPARGFFRLFTKAVDQVSTDMRAGKGAAVLDVPLRGRRVRIAAPICFEVAYNEIVSESVRKGATLLTVPTNNASFGDSAESRQQFDMTRFRAVETRRTAIQISTMGVSGVVDADGTVREKTGMWTADARVASVGLHTHVTPAVRWGGPIRLACNLAAGATTALALWQTRRLPQRRRLGRRQFGRLRPRLPNLGDEAQGANGPAPDPPAPDSNGRLIPSESRTESIGIGNIGNEDNKEER